MGFKLELRKLWPDISAILLPKKSTLTITTAKLGALETTSIFTWDVTSGQYPDPEAASNTMTLTILTFGRFSF